MTKKSLFSVCLFITLLVLSSCVFATDTLGDELQNSWNQTTNTFSTIGNNVGNAAASIGNGIGNMANNAATGIEDMLDENRSTNGTMGVTTTMNTDMGGNTNTNNTAATGTTGNNTNTGYTAERTAATTNGGEITGLSSTMITWIILAITAAIIVGLIWYYGTQDTHETRVRNQSND